MWHKYCIIIINNYWKGSTEMERKFSIKDAQYDESAIRREYYDRRGNNAIVKLQKNGFHASYFHNLNEAKEYLLKLIPDNSIVGVGDSHTVYAMNLDEDLETKGCYAIPNIAALNVHSYNSNSYGYIKAQTREEARKILADYLTSNVFLLGANAITMQGEIVNVDGVGNRIAGSLYGADRMIVVAGINKLVTDEAAARDRVKSIAAPMDNIKYGDECASVKAGICPSCVSPNRICNITTIIHRAPIESDFYVIIIGEELGF